MGVEGTDGRYVLGIVNSSGTLSEGTNTQRQVYDSAGSAEPQVMNAIPFSQKFVVGSATEPYGLCEAGFLI